ncbi:MAG: fasciclin domain-containing protein [Phycisphaerales bacterium]
MIRTSVCAVTLSMLAGSAFAKCSGTQDRADQTPRLRAASFTAEHESGNAVDVTKGAGSFKTLVAASAHAGNLTSKKGRSGWSIEGSGITATDIDASNGVIHVIDTVMMPK